MKCTYKTNSSSGFDFADMICCKEFVYMWFEKQAMPISYLNLFTQYLESYMFLVFLYLTSDVRFMEYRSPGQFIGWPGSGWVGGGVPRT